MKKIYSAPISDIIMLNTSTNVMDESLDEEKFSITGANADSNTQDLDFEDDEDFLRPSRSLWE